jgi:hypothetical protein
LTPGRDREQAREESEAAFGRPVEVAEVGKTWEI